MLTKMKSWEKQKMVNKVRAFTSGENQFYPTPKALIDKMLNESKYATIIIGSAQDSRSSKNIFNAEERI